MGSKLLLLFIVGDILGAGVYALTGDVAAEVDGAAWAPFVVAFVVATLTAFGYLELVTKYSHAAGAALYAHKAFGIHFVTFLACFTVMSSGVTSAATASRAFAANLVEGFELAWGPTSVMLIALGFMALRAAINLRGISESVTVDVVLTLVELTGLLVVIVIGFIAIGRGDADLGRVTVFDTADERSSRGQPELVAGGLIGLGVVLWALTWFGNPSVRQSGRAPDETREAPLTAQGDGSSQVQRSSWRS